MTELPDSPPLDPFSRALKKILLYGVFLAGGIASVGAVIGGTIDGWRGIFGAVIGAFLALVFMGLTAVSILLVNRFSGSVLYGAVFFGVVMGTWLLKLVVFLVLVFVLRGAPWLNPVVLFFSVVTGVVGSLVLDVVVVARARIPYVSAGRSGLR